MAWGKRFLLSLSVFCHQATEVLTRWQQSENTVTRVVRVLDDFDSSTFAAFEVDVLQRGESRP